MISDNINITIFSFTATKMCVSVCDVSNSVIVNSSIWLRFK